MPINYKDYPSNWKEISKAVIERANNKCELCYAPNHHFIWRQSNVDTHPFILLSKATSNSTKIILTVHHINFNKQDNSKHNLIALCQRCHLKLDMAHHVKNRRESKEKHQLRMEYGNMMDNSGKVILPFSRQTNN